MLGQRNEGEWDPRCPEYRVFSENSEVRSYRLDYRGKEETTLMEFTWIWMYVEWILSFHLRLDPSDGSFLPISWPETCKNVSSLQCVFHQLTRIHGMRYKFVMKLFNHPVNPLTVLVYFSAPCPEDPEFSLLMREINISHVCKKKLYLCILIRVFLDDGREEEMFL